MYTYVTDEIQIPRFRVEYETDLKNIVSALGLSSWIADPDFSGLGASSGGRGIDSIIHKTFVECNEQGTEAAAVTAVIQYRCEPLPPIRFIANRPFVFVIHTCGVIHFLGVIHEPTVVGRE